MNPPPSKYSPTNPRPLSQYESILPIRYFYTTDTRGFHFCDKDSFEAATFRTVYSKKGKTYLPVYLRDRSRVSSKEVFYGTSIFPFSRDFRRHPLSNDEKFQELCEVHNHNIFPGQRRIYRITDSTICDEYGRVFGYDERTGLWKWIPLNLGADNRGSTQIEGLRLKSYTWPALAGLKSSIQIEILAVPSNVIHHTTENTLIFAPTYLAPVSASFHANFIHFSPESRGRYSVFDRRWSGSPYFRCSSGIFYARGVKK